MKILIAAFMAWVMTSGWACAAPPHEKGAYLGARSTEYPDWFKDSFLDLREDIAEAGARGRRVMMIFTQDNCPYCNLLVERNLSQRDIVETLKTRFDVIALNLWGDRELKGLDGTQYTEKSFGAALKVQFTPAILFFDEAGNTILRLNGYVPPLRFKAALDWAGGRETQPFRDFVAAREAGAGGGGALIAEDFFLKDAGDLRRQGASARPLAVFFEQKDCPDCVTLHTRVLADPETRTSVARFDNVQLDMWAKTPIVTPDGVRTTVREWAAALDVKYAPGIVLFDTSGKEIIRWESSFRVFHTTGIFDYVLTGAYRTEPSFQRFLSAQVENLREAGKDVNIWRYADEPLAGPPAAGR